MSKPTFIFHAPASCAGSACAIHNPSAHHMRDWPINARESTLIERVCPHGIGHPDPDSLAYFKRRGWDGYGVHGCDNCCRALKVQP